MQNHIYMNYRDTLRKAQQLENLAGRLTSISRNSVQSAISDAGNNWSGDSRDSFCDKAGCMSEKIEGHAAALRNAAQGLRSMARRYQLLEEAAHQIFGN